jgi:isoleucyl-tRNA synthetase
MFVMADGLSRLLAPILPVTADELWRFLPAGAEAPAGTAAASASGTAARDASVHMAVFPKDVERFAAGALDDQWDRLRAIRDEVNKALEAARQAKTIGTSLAAHVRLTAGGETATLLRGHEADLPMLFIASQVSLDISGTEHLTVQVHRAEGEKCDRCWRIVSERSSDPRFAGVCLRCVDALETGDGREVA